MMFDPSSHASCILHPASRIQLYTPAFSIANRGNPAQNFFVRSLIAASFSGEWPLASVSQIKSPTTFISGSRMPRVVTIDVEAREALGLTQHDVAGRVGMTQRAVSYVEKQPWVKRTTLEKYGRVLTRQLSYFLRPYDEETQAPGLSREEAIQQAFAVVCRDPDFGFGRRPGEHPSPETRLDVVRLYERYKGVSLLPPDVI